MLKEGTVQAVKVGDYVRDTWLVHLPSLPEYIKKMDELGTQKHYLDRTGRDK